MLSVLVVVTLSILITRIGTIALVHTGLSRESARFQARSAFTGSGFTTRESESVVEHPVRRRIILLLMLLGNAGLVTAVSTLLLTFLGPRDGGSVLLRILLLVLGLTALWAIAASSWVDRHLSALIDRALRRHTRLDIRDYASLMHLAGDYRLVELQVRDTDWVAGRSLAAVRLRDEGIIVLGIRRPEGHYLGAPNGDTLIEAGDNLLLYGRGAAIEQLDRRTENMTAELRHEEAVDEELLVREAQQAAGGQEPSGSASS